MHISRSLVLSSLVLSLALGACHQSAAPAITATDGEDAAVHSTEVTDATDEDESSDAETQDGDNPSPLPQDDPLNGPRAVQNRATRSKVVTASMDKTTLRSEVDLGNAEVGAYRAPIRASLIIPTHVTKPLPLLVVNHLRAPNCSDKIFAYPCPDGTSEMRYDQGMHYFGDALARQGYAVLIPDLGAAWIGGDVTQPYDQNLMWDQIMTRLIAPIQTKTEGVHNPYGLDAIAQIDLGSIGLVVHSRSGTIVDQAMKTLGEGRVKTVLAYAPAYDTLDPETFTPAPADVPYLGLVGGLDADVSASANLWIGEYLPMHRQSPMLVNTVPGLGHMYINRTLSAANLDDRIGCDVLDCPDAQEHERVLITAATDWFAKTLPAGQPGTETAKALPLGVGEAIPDQFAGLPARWLVATPGAKTIHLAPEDFVQTGTTDATVCRHADPMNPVPIKHACPDPETAVVDVASEVLHFTKAVAKVTAQDSRTLNLHVAPTSGGDPGKGGTTLTVRVKTNTNTHWDYTVDPTHPALMNRATKDDNGTYRLGTIRIPLPDSVFNHVITEIELSSDHPLELRSVDIAS